MPLQGRLLLLNLALLALLLVAASASPCLDFFSFALAAATAFPLLDECRQMQGRAIRVGVEREEEEYAEMAVPAWHVSVSSFLSAFLQPYGCTGGVESTLLSQSEAIAAVASSLSTVLTPAALDVVVSSPLALAQLLHVHGEKLSLLATSRRLYSYPDTDTVIDKLAGALVRRSDKHRDIVLWSDLLQANRREPRLQLCAVSLHSFSGYQIQELELVEQLGARSASLFSVSFKGSMSRVLQGVRDGHCDLGMVNAAELEAFRVSQGTPLSEWWIVGAEQSDMLDDYPLPHSTRLYPEWGVLSLPPLPARVADLVRIALIAMDRRALQGSNHGGFSLQADYSPVGILAYQLDTYGDGRCPLGHERDSNPPRLCQPCSAGKFSDDELGMCKACSPGTFSNYTGAVRCQRNTQDSSHHSIHPPPRSKCGADEDDEFSYLSMMKCEQFPDNTIKIGVVSILNNPNLTLARWRPIFEGLLNEQFNDYQCFFRMVVLSTKEMTSAVESAAIDFLFANPAAYVSLKRKYHVRAVSSVLLSLDGSQSPLTGGIMFRRSDRNHDLDSISALANASLSRYLIACPPASESFAGWYVIWYEFFKQNIDVYEVFHEIIFTGSYEASLAMVAAGECDIGMVPEGGFVSSMSSGRYRSDLFTIINQYNRPGFSWNVSTALYPSWALMVLNHVPQGIASLVSVPLFMPMEPAENGGYAGFVPMLDYSAVHEVMYQLNVIDPNSGVCYPGSFRDYSHPSPRLTPCIKCAPGRFNENGYHDCAACAPGYYSNQAESSSCTHCAPGTTTEQAGMTECTPQTKGPGYELSQACGTFPNRTLTVAVISNTDPARIATRWKPTFEGVLNDFFGPYKCHFRMVTVPSGTAMSDMGASIAESDMGASIADFVLADNAHAVLLRMKKNMSIVASLFGVVPSVGHVSRYGGVMFRWANRNNDLISLSDIVAAGSQRTLTACAVGPDSFFGWQVQWLEFFEQGVDVRKVFQKIIYTYDEELILEFVNQGVCEVGMLQTGIIEGAAFRGKYRMEDIVVLSSAKPTGYPFVVSTRLYRWSAFGILPHVPLAISDVVVLPLLLMHDGDSIYMDSAKIDNEWSMSMGSISMLSDGQRAMVESFDYNAVARKWHNALQAGSYAGFMKVTNYSQTEYLVYQLNLVDFNQDTCYPGSQRDLNGTVQPCVKCRPGYSNPDGIGECTACPTGFISKSYGGIKCERCEPDKTTLGPASSHCVDPKAAEYYSVYSACQRGERNLTYFRPSGLTDYLPPATTVSCQPYRGAARATIALTGLSVFLALACFYFAWRHRAYKLFKDVGSAFYNLFCTGAALVSLCAVFWVLPVSNSICLLRIRLLAVSGTVLFSPLLIQSHLWLRENTSRLKSSHRGWRHLTVSTATQGLTFVQAIWAVGSLFLPSHSIYYLQQGGALETYQVQKGNAVSYHGQVCAVQHLYAWSALGLVYLLCFATALCLLRLQQRQEAPAIKLNINRVSLTRLLPSVRDLSTQPFAPSCSKTTNLAEISRGLDERYETFASPINVSRPLPSHQMLDTYKRSLQKWLRVGVCLVHLFAVFFLLIRVGKQAPFTPEYFPVEAWLVQCVPLSLLALVFLPKCRQIGVGLNVSPSMRLWRAARSRDAELVAALITKQQGQGMTASTSRLLDWQHSEQDGTTALMQAILGCKAVGERSKNKEKTHTKSAKSTSFSCLAAVSSSPFRFALYDATPALAIISKLLESGARADNVDDSGRSALHHAAKCGLAEACKLLLPKEAGHLYLPDDKGQTPLEAAQANGHVATCAVLSAALRANQATAPILHTLLTFACKQQQARSRANQQAGSGLKRRGSKFKHQHSSNTPNQPATSPVSTEAGPGGAGQDAPSSFPPSSPSSIFAGQDAPSSFPPSSPNSIFGEKGPDLPFDTAYSTIMISDIDADTNKFVPKGLHHDIELVPPQQCGQAEAKAGGRSNNSRPEEMSSPDGDPTHALVHSVKQLLQSQADPNASFADLHPLIVAARLGKPGLGAGNLLLRYRADVSVQDQSGCTALLEACKHNQNELVRSLVRAGAPLETRSKEGLTALDVAKANQLESQAHGKCQQEAQALVTFLSESYAVPHISMAEVTFLELLGKGDFGVVYSALYCGVIHAVKVPKHQAPHIDQLLDASGTVPSGPHTQLDSSDRAIKSTLRKEPQPNDWHSTPAKGSVAFPAATPVKQDSKSSSCNSQSPLPASPLLRALPDSTGAGHLDMSVDQGRSMPTTPLKLVQASTSPLRTPCRRRQYRPQPPQGLPFDVNISLSPTRTLIHLLPQPPSQQLKPSLTLTPPHPSPPHLQLPGGAVNANLELSIESAYALNCTHASAVHDSDSRLAYLRSGFPASEFASSSPDANTEQDPGYFSMSAAMRAISSNTQSDEGSNTSRSTAFGLFLHEAVISHKIGAKPRVVQFRGADLSRDHTMLVYEYFPANSLEQFLKSAPPVCKQLPRMLTEAATGLWAMHKARIVHRDVAARNFLVDAHGQCAICDFGVSQELPVGAEEGVFPGGPWKSMAPEAMPPRNIYSFKTDCYMFGIFLWEVLARQAPYPGFGHREAANLVQKDGNFRPRISSDWPEGYVSLMKQCWHPEPSCRPSMEQIFNRLKYLEETGAMFAGPSPLFSPCSVKANAGTVTTAAKDSMLVQHTSVAVDNVSVEPAWSGRSDCAA
eukprot:g8140.t1